jgi:hypothetical protein
LTTLPKRLKALITLDSRSRECGSILTYTEASNEVFRLWLHTCSGATTIASHPRQLPNTVRRVDTSRKEAREKKKERKEEIKAVKREEVNRLKALKVREIRSKIEKIEKEAGMVFKLDEGALERLENELEDDWDAEKYDQKMKELYGDDGFYEVEVRHILYSRMT